MRDVSDEFAKDIVILAEAYGAKLSEARIRVYYEDLQDIPTPLLRSALKQARQSCRFFPTVADIRQFAIPSIDDSALIAWAAFERAAARVGSWSPVVVEDAAAAKALVDTFGSWPAYCAESDTITLNTKRQQFIAAYRQRRREPKPQYAVSLEGLAGGYTGSGLAGLISSNGSVERTDRPLLCGVLGGDGYARPALREAGEEVKR